jgi:hypothetical protein
VVNLQAGGQWLARSLAWSAGGHMDMGRQYTAVQ